MWRLLLALLVTGLMALAFAAASACGGKQAAGKVFFIEPQDGAQVRNPFTVKMGTAGLVVEPALENIKYQKGHGHHHIVVDSPLPNLDQPIPKESLQHLHYGKGQREVTLELEPGVHTLRLLFAKGDHVPWVPAITDAIRITVIK